MNNIIRYFKNIKVGLNNHISSSAIIHDNVIIGNNNKIYDNVVIYPNTIIGDNNIIYNNNIIGEYPIQNNGTFKDYNFKNTKGTIIGNNNFFHIKNIIYSGIINPTQINNNNNILGENHIGHDCIIHDNVSIYPRTLLCGHVRMMNHSNSGVYSFIHQHKIVGQYSMIGGNSSITKNVFPYFININNKITKLNIKKIPNEWINYKKELEILANDYTNNKIILDNLPNNIKNDLKIYIDLL